MAVEFYVEDILRSPEATFRRILSTIIAKSDKQAEIELVRQYREVDTVLFEAIKSILFDLKVEEGLISRFFYRFFRVEIFTNKKREQLIILGSQLKMQYGTITKQKKRVHIHMENLLASLRNLKELEGAFDKQVNSLNNQREINKSNALMAKINLKIQELAQYENLLEHKYTILSDIEKIYNGIYQQIPNYYELQEENRIPRISAP
ncbi:MAG TPA: hypothetical protein EYG90_02620 [Campylobacterales bacterium]|nr:hypothetical protein [Campylobacterales bacterium]